MAYMELGLYTLEFPNFLHDFDSEVGYASELTLKGSPNLVVHQQAGCCFCCIIGSWDALYSLCDFANHDEEVFVTTY